MGTLKKAFTLVELLVVVAIIVVLIAILLPSLGEAKRQAQTVACGSNLKQIGLAMQMYSQEYNQYYTPFMTYCDTLTSSDGTVHYGNWKWACYLNPDQATGMIIPRWFNLLRTYTSTYKVFNCAVQNSGTWGTWSGANPGNNTQVASVDREPGLAGTVSTWIVAGRSGVGATCNYTYNPKSFSEIADPSQMWTPSSYKARTYGEVMGLANSANVPFNNLVVVMDGYHMITDAGTSIPTDSYDLYRACGMWRYIHAGKKANVLFPDWHVEPAEANQISSAGSPKMIFKH